MVNIMKINGIGTIKKSEAMDILTSEGKRAVKDGTITAEELGGMYKLHQVEKAAWVGQFGDTFRKCYAYIPEDLRDQLTPEQLGKLTDQFYRCYRDGKNDKREE